MTTFSADLAKFLVGLRTENMPPEVVQKARVCLYNAFGMGINGHATPYAPVARAAALALDGEVAGGATLFLDGRRTTIGGACLANSALFHGRAQEDTCGAAHFGTILIPLLTAMIEAQRLSAVAPHPGAGRGLRGRRRAREGAFRQDHARRFPLLGDLRHDRRERGGSEAHGAFGRADNGGARQRGVVRRRRAAILRRRHRRMALSGRRGRAQRPGRGRTGARRLGVRAKRLRGQIRLRSRVRPGRSRRQSCGFARQGLGHSARGVQAVPGVRVQPDAGHRRAGAARTIARRARTSARAHESVRDRLCRHGCGRAVQHDFGHADEHSVLHRHHARPRRADDAPHDDLRRSGGERSDHARRARDRCFDPDLERGDRSRDRRRRPSRCASNE